jgi:hypothetical protein
MRTISIALGLLLTGGVAAAEPNPAPTPAQVHVVRAEAGLFYLVRNDTTRKLRAVCGGADPVETKVFHTVADGFAAVMTGILYTPAHIRFTCPSGS